MSATIPMIQNDVDGLFFDSVMMIIIWFIPLNIDNKFKMSGIELRKTNQAQKKNLLKV
jgi:hypothetical protein